MVQFAGVRYSVEHHGDKFLIVTNKDGAMNNKFMSCTAQQVMEVPLTASWDEVKAYDPAVQIESITPFQTFLAIFGREVLRIMYCHFSNHCYIDTVQ